MRRRGRWLSLLVAVTGMGLWLCAVGCPSSGGGGDGGPAAGDEGGACLAGDTCNGALVCNTETDLCESGGGEGEGEPVAAALPAKSIALDLIGTHDAGSDSYNDDCIGCHGDRSNEVALDGVTPTAHATMMSLFGTGNERCRSCHESGPEFVAFSSAALREQVPISDCASCHGADAARYKWIESAPGVPALRKRGYPQRPHTSATTADPCGQEGNRAPPQW